MNISRKLLIGITAGIACQVGVYWYLDQVLFAPASAFQVESGAQAEEATSGKVYYSFDRKFMARVKDGAIEILGLPGKQHIRTVELSGQYVTYFKWLEDRNLALVGLAHTNPVDQTKLILRQLNPVGEGVEQSTTISNLAKGSIITDVAYSTATNVVYIQVQVSRDPETYRIYRIDANHELERTFLNTSKIGRIGVLFDQDTLVLDNLENDTIVARNGNGSWQVISPTVGKYRLITVDNKNNVYIGKLGADGLVQAIFKGNAKGNFMPYRTLQTPMNLQQIKVGEKTEP